MERLADYVDLLTGFPFKSEAYTADPDGVPLVRGDNVVQGRLRWDNAARWPTRLLDGTDRYRLDVGDVVLAMDRPWIEAGLKYARITRGDVPSLLVQRVARLRARPKMDQGFLYCLIGSRAFANHVLAVQTGTAVPHISSAQILEFRFRLPVLEEQHGIASVLGALDDKIEQNRRTSAALERLARAIFQAWFVDFEPVKAKAAGATSFPSMPQETFDALPRRLVDSELGPVPEGWEVTRWGEVIALEYGKGLRGYQDALGEYRVFGTNGPIGWHADCLTKGPGIIVGRKGAYRGVHYSPFGFWVIDTAFFVRPKRELDTKWAYYEILRSDINSMDSGSAIPSTSRDDFYAIRVCVPSIEVMQAFHSMVGPLFDLNVAMHLEDVKLGGLRDYLLPRLLSGQIRVRDAERANIKV